MPKNPSAVSVSGILCLKGTLTDEGVECQTFRDTQNTLYTLIGDLGGFSDGDQVVVCGTVATASFCLQGTTLAVSSISHPHGYKDTKSRKRDVEVKITRSSADSAPAFKLEGKPLPLQGQGSVWVGQYPEMIIEGPLQIFFHSGGWKNQLFDLVVTVKTPTKPGKDKTADYHKTTMKGDVTFDESMELD